MGVWNMKSNWKFLDSDALKVIAIVTMLIDHIGAVVVSTTLNLMGQGDFDKWYSGYWMLRNIGRTAFPLFVFLLVEGFFHTRNKIKYCGRLVLFAMLSEIPFDVAFYGRIYYIDSQNVFWTLAIGFLVIWGIEKGREIGAKRAESAGASRWYFVLFEAPYAVLLVLAGCFAAKLWRTDYSWYGVLLIALFYFGKRWNAPRILTCIAGYLLFLWEPYSIGGFLLILFYNGARKKRGRGFQYFFYLFYPVHLLILRLISINL